MTRGVFVTRKEAESTTLSEALDRYETEISSKKKSHSIETVYIRTIKKSRLAQLFIGTTQGKDIAGYRDKRLKEVSSSSVRHELAILSHLFTIAVKEWGMTGLINPVMQIRRPSPNKARDRRLKPGELDRILDVSPASLKPIVMFAVETGMRRSEIAGMTWEMVDLKKRIVTLLVTKNGAKRIVPLSTEAVRILSSLVRRIDGKVWDLIATSIMHAFILASQTAKIEDLTFHDLRHEATSRFFEKGLNPMQVAAITGHKTLQMLKRYTHLKAEDLAGEFM
ncbi:MAG: site-specific integrase [Leptospirillia bacterium]